MAPGLVTCSSSEVDLTERHIPSRASRAIEQLRAAGVELGRPEQVSPVLTYADLGPTLRAVSAQNHDKENSP